MKTSNESLRELYREHLKKFKNLQKQKKQKFHADKLSEIDRTWSRSNRDFWKILKSADENIKDSKIPPEPQKE